MDLHQRKSGRLLPGADLRSCMPGFYPSGKQLPKQDALIPFQHSSCSTQVFSFDQAAPPPQMLEPLTQHQDIEYITLPVYKTRKNDPQQHFAQSDVSILDGRFHHTEGNATLDLRSIQNLSYSTIPEPHPYFCLRPRNQIHQESQKFMAFQPPPRSPRRDPTARALVSQHCEEDHYQKNFIMRRPTSEVQIPIPFQWVEVNQNKQKVMKPIPEKSYEMFPENSNARFTNEKPKKKRFQGNRSDNFTNLSTTSHSSLDSLSHYSKKCSCSGDSRRRSKSVYSVGNQTDFLKSPLEEKFLFRETILFGCDEIGKWARKLPMVSEIADMGDYIREKTTQSRAQNICSALGLEVEDQVIVSGYLKVFLKVADSWLEARNCFGLTDNCMRKACQLNSPEISQNYLEWQHASRRLLGNIVHGVGSVLAPKETNSENKSDCRQTQSTTNIHKHYNRFSNQKRPLMQRSKWTISDTASTTSQCSSGIRGEPLPQPPRYFHEPTEETTSPAPHPIVPQHKMTPLSQIEPPCLRKSDSTSVDISAWFSGKNERFPQNLHKSQSVTVVYGPNEQSQDSSDDILQKIYMKPGSYNVPKKKLSSAKKRNNVQKAKESCFGDTDIQQGYVIPFSNAGPFVPPPSRGMQHPNIKIVKNTQENSDRMTQNEEKEENLKDNVTQEKDLISKEVNLKKMPSKTMKTDEWILSTLMNSQALKINEGSNKQLGKLILSKSNSDKAEEKAQEANQSQASSDKSSHGIEENMTNRSQTSVASRSAGKTSKASRSVWHNSKRRRALSQRTSNRIEEVVNDLWKCDVPDYLQQAIKVTQLVDYYKIVKHPVFLETITNKVKNGTYETAEQFVHDSRRLIFNALQYFEKDKTATEKISKFSEHLEKQLQETFENWDCWTHITGDPREVHFYPELRYSNNCSLGKKRSKTPKNGSKKEEKFYEQ